MYKHIAVLLCTAGLLGGCGLTGDLYLPEDEAATESGDVPRSPADEEDGESEADEE